MLFSMCHQKTRVAEHTEWLLRELSIDQVRPRIGTMTMRPEHNKVRSIKHCSQLAGPRRMRGEAEIRLRVLRGLHRSP